jgi:hypothetical protein
MVPHPLAALDQPEVADDAIRPAAHAGELRTLKMIAHTQQHARSMHPASIPSILTTAESTRRRAKPSKRCVVAALADAMYLRGPNRHAIQHGTSFVQACARRIRLRKTFQYLDTDFLRDRTIDLAHAIPEPDDFPLLLDIHWSPPRNDQKEHNKNGNASWKVANSLEAEAENLQATRFGPARFRLRRSCLL